MGLPRVQEIMDQHPVSINSNDYVTHARQLMRDYHRTLPVVDERNIVLGILSEQDVLHVTSTKSNVTVKGYTTEVPVITGDMDLKQAATTMLQAMTSLVPVLTSIEERKLCGTLSILDIFNNLDPSKMPEMHVSELMTQNVKTCSGEDPVAKVWTNMMREGYSGYPVVDKHNIPVGMVTRHDIIRTGGVRIEREDEHGTRIGTSSTVSRIMSTPAYTITPDTSFKETIELMAKLDVGRLCVINPNELVGIIDRYDVVRAYIDEKKQT
ncbi:MAG: CBS domain-containing protein [ANME-2 cluster archaeon]|nr:CBS domain-containing protein [ANME-2 cluster archaeon]